MQSPKGDFSNGAVKLKLALSLPGTQLVSPQLSAAPCLLYAWGQTWISSLHTCIFFFLTKSEFQEQPELAFVSSCCYRLYVEERAWDPTETQEIISENVSSPLSGLTQCSLHPECAQVRLLHNEAF